MNVGRLNFKGDPNLGLYGTCNEEICLVGHNTSSKEVKKIEKVLEVEAIKCSIAGSNLIGIFTALNVNGIVLPQNIEEDEVEELSQKLENYEININVMRKVDETALGNLILVNDKGCIIGKELKKEKKKFKEIFEVKTETGKISELDVVGSCGKANNNGVLTHRNVKENEMEKLERVLKVRGNIGTANFGSPFIGACILANSKGALISWQTTGYELGRIEQVLG